MEDRVDEPYDETLTLAEAAAILKLSMSTVKKQARAGTLPGILPKLGSQWRVSGAALHAFTHPAP